LKLGSMVRYDVHDLNSWLATRRRTSTAQDVAGGEAG
jgi:hypothetical protein